jgi:hypothetical protein
MPAGVDGDVVLGAQAPDRHHEADRQQGLERRIEPRDRDMELAHAFSSGGIEDGRKGIGAQNASAAWAF